MTTNDADGPSGSATPDTPGSGTSGVAGSGAAQPTLGRAIVTWIVFIVLLSGAGVLVLPASSPEFVISAVMLAVGGVFGAALVVARILGRRGG
jgi:hypothetical protein